MKIKVIFILILVFLLSACNSTWNCRNTDNSQISLDIEKAVKIQIRNGKLVVLDNKGKVISQEAKLPLKLYNDAKNYQAKSLTSVDEITIISIKGSCHKIVKYGISYVDVFLPDGHPWCNK